jgi:hypothetical protein
MTAIPHVKITVPYSEMFLPYQTHLGFSYDAAEQLSHDCAPTLEAQGFTIALPFYSKLDKCLFYGTQKSSDRDVVISIESASRHPYPQIDSPFLVQKLADGALPHGMHWFVFEHAGLDLKRCLEKGLIATLPQMLSITLAASEGLDAIHKKIGRAHGDLHRGNIMIQETGTIKIGDLPMGLSLSKKFAFSQDLFSLTVSVLEPMVYFGSGIDDLKRRSFRANDFLRTLSTLERTRGLSRDNRWQLSLILAHPLGEEETGDLPFPYGDFGGLTCYPSVPEEGVDENYFQKEDDLKQKLTALLEDLQKDPQSS